MDKLTRTIKAVSIKRKAEKEIGFLTTEEDRWYNIRQEEKSLDLLLATIIKKGNIIEFEITGDTIMNLALKEAAKEKEGSWSDDIVDFDTLMKAAHAKKEKFEIKTEMLHIDWNSKEVLFKAQIIVTPDAAQNFVQIFEAHGDATKENVNGDVGKHWIRIAETRAIVRALRWYTNNAAKAAEEEK